MDSHSSQNEGFRILEEFVCQAIPDPSTLASRSLKIEIDWPGVSIQNVLDELVRALPEEHGAQVALSVEPPRRSPGALAMNPTIISGIIQSVAMVLCPFLTALLIRVQEHKGKSLVIILPDKTKHELGTDASPEQINQVAAAMEGAGSARITIVE
jgi:hypothetical protein